MLTNLRNPSTREQPAACEPARTAAPEDDVRTQIWSLVTTLLPHDNMVERRSEQRYPFPYLIYLTPSGTMALARRVRRSWWWASIFRSAGWASTTPSRCRTGG